MALPTVKSPRDTVGAAAAAAETDPADGYLSEGHPATDPGSTAVVTMNHDLHLYQSSLSTVTAHPLRSMQSPGRQGNRVLYNGSVHLLTAAAPTNVRVRLERGHTPNTRVAAEAAVVGDATPPGPAFALRGVTYPHLLHGGHGRCAGAPGRHRCRAQSGVEVEARASSRARLASWYCCSASSSSRRRLSGVLGRLLATAHRAASRRQAAARNRRSTSSRERTAGRSCLNRAIMFICPSAWCPAAGCSIVHPSRL